MFAPKKILITAGPTREMLDPVRFLSNLSTGVMGYTLARAAASQGYKVTLISGPTALKRPPGVRYIPIVTALELKAACQKEFDKHDVLVMTAAVCDFMSRVKQLQKIQRKRTKMIHLKQTPDIVAGLAKGKGKRLVIGFCLETSDWLQNAKRKLKEKKLDGMVANFYKKRHVPFGENRITTAFISQQKTTLLRKVSKRQIAQKLLVWLDILQEQNAGTQRN